MVGPCTVRRQVEFGAPALAAGLGDLCCKFLKLILSSPSYIR